MNFSKEGVKKRQKKLTSKNQRYSRRFFIDFFKIVFACVVLVVLILAGAGFGMIKGILDDSPDIESVDIKPKGFKTIIYDENGTEERELSTINSNRVFVGYEDIPDQMKNAVVAIEDERFWKHNGIDMKGIFRALSRDVISRNFSEGASTITQQLIKNSVFNVGMDEVTKLQKIERKVQEQFLAMDLEKKYSKEDILEAYLNTIYLGEGVNGVEAAANRYFDKSVKDLTLSEISVIAGIPKNPYLFNPIDYPEYNDNRRTDVLDKMLENGYITKKEYKEAINDNVYDRIQEVKKVSDENYEVNSFYEDAIMNALHDEFMELYDMSDEQAWNELYTGGYQIYSVQDKGMQEIVDRKINDPEYYPSSNEVALEYKLTLMDKDTEETYNYDNNTLVSYYQILNEDDDYDNIYDSEEDARSAANKYKEAMINKTKAIVLAEEFNTSIQPQASVSIIDQSTGYIKAIGGGRGEKKENLSFNRATDALRQPGSTFKVLASFLPYIDVEGGLGSVFDDAPYTYDESTGGGEVRNWYGSYYGPSNLRKAIAQSMNVIAVKAITEVTPKVAYDYLLKEGFTSLVEYDNGYSDIHQATALGGLTQGIKNIEITAAYAGIANMGTYTKPVYYSKVYDHDGECIIDNTNPADRSHKMCEATTAYQLIDGMKECVTTGTGTPARMQTGIQCAGKTGTTSNSYDYWFCGFTPYLTASVWNGYDYQKEEPDTALHKALWRDIMDEIAEKYGHSTEADWEVPSGLEKVSVCADTGLLPTETCNVLTDWFTEDHAPQKYCKGHLRSITLCKQSHLIATNACPEKETFTVKYGENGAKVLVGATFPYNQDVFSSTCPIHPEVVNGVTITTGCDPGGQISPTVTISSGTSTTIYVTPAPGYVIADVTVDGASIGPNPAVQLDNVTENHSVYAYFKPAEGQVQTATPEEQGGVQPDTEAPPAPQPEPDTEAPPAPEEGSGDQPG
ncbi:MAG: transglycosylase domain-containing protein [Eubacterium sp.]|nr:transglycosylase domain-containing protein [Eubacterium sp.]